MNPDLFTLLSTSAPLKAIMGDPLRVYPWGRAPQNTTLPYAAYGVYNGNPENYLDVVPDIDNKGTQLTVYDEDPEVCEQVATIIRDILEPSAHMTSFATPDREAETDRYSCRLEFDFWEQR